MRENIYFLVFRVDKNKELSEIIQDFLFSLGGRCVVAAREYCRHPPNLLYFDTKSMRMLIDDTHEDQEGESYLFLRRKSV